MALTGVVVVMVLLGVGLAGVLTARPGARGQAAGSAPAGSRRPADTGPGSTSARAAAPSGALAPARAAAHPASVSPRTSCRAVAHVGDSTSVGMISSADLPDPARRLPAQYARVGVRTATVDAVGGRSAVETLPGTVNGYDAARAIAARGFHGCWVFALGTNDTANVAAGSAVGRLVRIERMMALAHGRPALWVNVKTLDAGGPYAESNMRLWNAALDRASHRYPNMRIYDWAAAARDGWFIPDGIHYTPAGYALRAHLIANALAKAFPQGARSSGAHVK